MQLYGTEWTDAERVRGDVVPPGFANKRDGVQLSQCTVVGARDFRFKTPSVYVKIRFK